MAATYVLILTPTRELAVQIHSMIQKLAQYTDVQAALVVGGLSVQVCVGEVLLTAERRIVSALLSSSRVSERPSFCSVSQVQASVLRKSPEIVVATPGRLIDHLRNSQVRA